MASRRLAVRLGGLVAWVRSALVFKRCAEEVCIAVVLVGCTSGATTRIDDGALGRAGIVTIVLTASIQSQPFSEADLAQGPVATAVAACERSGGGTACKERRTPGEPQDRFSRDANERVHVFVSLIDLEPRRWYECTVRFFGPDGGVFARVTKRIQSPDPVHPSHQLFFIFESSARAMRPGRWRAEIAVNGEVEAERTFEVIASVRA
jgi:hypothetical protein